jgi:hypothetical protein
VQRDRLPPYPRARDAGTRRAAHRNEPGRHCPDRRSERASPERQDNLPCWPAPNEAQPLSP